jgi:hypothetical protein
MRALAAPRFIVPAALGLSERVRVLRRSPLLAAEIVAMHHERGPLDRVTCDAVLNAGVLRSCAESNTVSACELVWSDCWR